MLFVNVLELKNGSLTNDTIFSAFKALRRFQIIYELEVNELTNGNINEYTFEKFDGKRPPYYCNIMQYNYDL